MSGRYTTEYRQDLRRFRTRPQRLVAVAIGLFAIAIPFILETGYRPPMGFPWSAWLTAINLALVASIGAAAFNLLLGYTHQISVAHAAFLMVGTMVAAFLGVVLELPFGLVVVASLVAGALVGTIVALPALRFRGLYLLVATFGVHFFALFAYRVFQVRFFGFSGIRFPAPALPGWIPFLPEDPDGSFAIFGNFRWYWVLLLFAVFSVWFMSNVVRTREGRAFQAIAEHDVAASLIGINVVKSKVLAFAVSSAFVSLSGALSSYYVGARGEDSFPFAVVLNFAIMIIVGGYATMTGAVLGAFFFYLAPLFFEWGTVSTPILRDIAVLQRYESEVHLGIFGLLIIIVLVVRPSGLAGVWNSTKGYFARWPYTT
jgi:branched-chain amino acid transport system permease protein